LLSRAHTPRLLPFPASRHLVPPLPLMPYLPRAPLAAHSVSHCYRMTIPVVPRRVIFFVSVALSLSPLPSPSVSVPCQVCVVHPSHANPCLLTQWFVILASPSAADEPHAPAHPGAGRMHCQPLCPLSALVGPRVHTSILILPILPNPVAVGLRLSLRPRSPPWVRIASPEPHLPPARPHLIRTEPPFLVAPPHTCDPLGWRPMWGRGPRCLLIARPFHSIQHCLRRTGILPQLYN